MTNLQENAKLLLLLNTLHLLPRQLYPYEENHCRDVIYDLPDADASGVHGNTQAVEALCEELKPEAIPIAPPNAQYDEVCFKCGKAIEPDHVNLSMPKCELATINPSGGNKFVA